MKKINPNDPSLVDRYTAKLIGVLKKKKHILSEAEAFENGRQWHGGRAYIMATTGLLMGVAINFSTMYDGVFQELERSANVPAANSSLAAMISGGVALLIFLAWHTLYAYAPRCRTSWARRVGYTYSFVLLVFTFIASSTPTLMGLTHSITRPMHMHDMVSEAAAMINIITDSSRDAKAVIPTLEGLKSEACSSRDLESGTGIISRTGRGVGVATGAFNSACEGTAGVLASIRASISKANHSASEINKTLEQLFILVDDRNKPVLEREDKFKKAMASLDRLIREFHNDGLGKVAQTGVVTLKSLVPHIDENSGMKQGARVAINGIHQKLNNAADQLKSVLNDDDGRVLKSVNYRATLVEISYRYMKHFPFQIGMSMFLDFFPFFIFWALILFHAKEKSRNQAHDELDNQLNLNPIIPDDLFKKEHK
jgi:hypothetical protein